MSAWPLALRACWMGLSWSLGLMQSVAPSILAHSNFLGFLSSVSGSVGLSVHHPQVLRLAD